MQVVKTNKTKRQYKTKRLVELIITTLILISITKISKAAFKGYTYRAAASEAAYAYSDILGKDIDDYFYLESQGASTKDKKQFCLNNIIYYMDKNGKMGKAGVKHFTRLYITNIID